MTLPEQGMQRDAVLARLNEYKAGDIRWRDGRAFSLVYHAGDEVLAVAEDAYKVLAAENALNTDAFPSLRRVQQEVVGIVSEWLDGGNEAAGFLTTGGTESLLMAVKAARAACRKEKGITTPNVVLPTGPRRA
jgi:glutamate/tyrosine decarboxylase-like PLP-dependent enzyme